MKDQRGTDDGGDPFATGGHGRFMSDGVAPPVIGALPMDDVDETVRVNPGDLTRGPAHDETVRVDRREVVYDRDPPTSPIPAAAAEPAKKGWLGKLFGRA
ncbi:hypothetical protein [Actinokineospora sp.]|uniref:hypothetical protein n=1 Tax=Actinokineospora sp. TaxID=1872133 RepID=UPI0040376B4F